MFLFVFAFSLTFSAADQPTAAGEVGCEICDCWALCPCPFEWFHGHMTAQGCVPWCKEAGGLPCEDFCPNYGGPAC
jgi:hypothetical protein